MREAATDTICEGATSMYSILSGAGERELVAVAAGDQLVDEVAGLVELRVRLRDHVLAFLDRRQELDVLRDLRVLHAAVGRLDEAVLVGARVEGERVDEADVRAFRRLDRADAAVVGRVHVAHLEAGALAREAARSQRRDAALVGDLGERVRLVHELRELAGAEELLDRRGDGLRVDQVVRHQVLALGLREALADGALDAHEAGAELVLGEFADRAHAAVAEVVDVVDLAAAVAQLHEDADDRDDVVGGQRHRAGELVAAHAAVELHAADVGEVVAVLAEEEAVEERLDGLLGRRLAGAHHAVDGDLRVQLVDRLVDAQRLRDVRALVEVVRVDGLHLLHAGLGDLLEERLGDLLVGVGDDLARLLVDEALSRAVRPSRKSGSTVSFFMPAASISRMCFTVMRLSFWTMTLPAFVDDVEAGDLALQALGHDLELDALLAEVERVEGEELGEDPLRRCSPAP